MAGPGRGRPASSIRPVTAPTVVILAAGQGTRMRSRTPKVLHDLCGRPMIAWPVAAALAAGAGKVVVVDGPAAPARGPPARGRRARGPARGQRDRRRRAGRGRAPGRRAGARPQRRRPARHRRGALRPASRRTRPTARRRPSPRWSSTTRRATGASCAARTGRSSAWWRRRSPGDATAEQLAIREVNAGVYAFDGAALQGRPRAPDPRQRPGRALPARRRSSCSTASPPIALDDPTLLLGVNDRADLARVRALAQARIHRAAHARRGHDRRSRPARWSTSRSRSAPTR